MTQAAAPQLAQTWKAQEASASVWVVSVCLEIQSPLPSKGAPSTLPTSLLNEGKLLKWIPFQRFFVLDPEVWWWEGPRSEK